MSNILKIEAFAGMSGDMFLGALCGLADAYEEIKELPDILHLKDEVRIEVSDVNKTGVACKHVKVVDLKHVQTKHTGFSLNQDPHQHDHNHTHVHAHDDPTHAHTHTDHHHRHLKDIYQIIDNGHLSQRARDIAKKIFLALGEAEANVHGMPLEKIHFHEVGAIDSIMDIVGTAWLLDKLDITKTYSTPITTGFGFVMTEHGKLPIPCPATQVLLHGFPTQAGEQRGEMTTPTGAAILKYLNPDFEMPVLKEMKTNYGPGERDFEIPNTLRLSICNTTNKENEVIVMQTNIDDNTGEYLGIEFQDELFEAGALDVYMQQVIMKRGRPGIILNIMCHRADYQRLSTLITEKTSTIGIRYYPVNRLELERKNYSVTTSLGLVHLKEVTTPKGKKRFKVESKDIMRISKELNLSPQEINGLILNEHKNEKNK